MMKYHRSAFTLFQLLVVLALLGILLGLLLPAIAKVRQAAARTQSANNLKQLGLGVHNYYSSFNALPPGVDGNHFSTTAYLLPFLEQDNLFKNLDFKKPIDDQANALVRGTVIRIMLNPMDPVQVVKQGWGATNYLWCAGAKYDLKDNDGMFYRDSKLTFDKVPDGLSNTMMAGETLKGDGMEKAVDMKRQHVLLKADALKDLKEESGVQDWKDNKNIVGDRCASWLDGRFLQGTFTGTRMANDPKPDVNCEGQGGLSGLRSLNNGSNVLFGDGSVRFVNDKVKFEVWKLLADRRDGQAIPEF
jgi:prepilin-type processing-associated H-X9-DG protein